MMQQPLLPVTVKDGNVTPTPNRCNHCICAYIVIMLIVITIVLATLIYFSTQPTVFKGAE